MLTHRRRSHLRALLASLVLLLAVAPTSAHAAPTVFALSDGAALPPEGAVGAKLTSLSGQLCAPKATKPKAIAFGTARSTAAKLAQKGAGKKAIARFAKSADAKTANRALAAAGAATAAGKPYAALVALLRAERLAPRDARPLVSAAPVLTNLGRPQEALAYLAEAEHRTGAKDGAFGTGTAARIANNRAYALLALGQWKSAEAQATKAAGKAPLLSEARRNAAHAQLCAGKVAAAAKSAVAGARRQGAPAATEVVQTTAESGLAPLEQAAPARWLDLTHGAQLALPVYKIPRDEAEAAALRDSLEAKLAESRAAVGTAQAAYYALAPKAAAEKAGLSPGSLARIDGLWFATNNLEKHPDLAPDYARFGAARNELTRLLTEYASGQGGYTCGHYGEVRSAYLGYDAAGARWYRLMYERGTAVAANASSPALHDALVANVRWQARIMLSTHLAMLGTVDAYGWHCYTEKAAPQEAAEQTADLADSAACPAGLKGKGLKIRLPFAGLKVDCESVGLEIDTGGWLGAFGSVSHNVVKGETTVFVGPRVKTNPGPWGPSATVKDGLYITVGNDGAIRDVGARVETGVTIGAGETGSVALKGETMDFSLVGVSPIATLMGG